MTLLRRILTWTIGTLASVGVLILAAYCLWCLGTMGGCLGGSGAVVAPRIPGAGAPTAPPIPGAPTFPEIAWLAGLCVALGALATIASFVPMIGPFVPRKAGLAAIAVGVGLYFLRDFMVHWLPVIRWAVLGLAVVGIVPFVVMYVRWWLDRLGKSLIGQHPDAAVALMSAARGLVGDKHKEKRRAMLASARGVAA